MAVRVIECGSLASVPKGSVAQSAPLAPGGDCANWRRWRLLRQMNQWALPPVPAALTGLAPVLSRRPERASVRDRARMAACPASAQPLSQSAAAAAGCGRGGAGRGRGWGGRPIRKRLLVRLPNCAFLSEMGGQAKKHVILTGYQAKEWSERESVYEKSMREKEREG